MDGAMNDSLEVAVEAKVQKKFMRPNCKPRAGIFDPNTVNYGHF